MKFFIISESFDADTAPIGYGVFRSKSIPAIFMRRAFANEYLPLRDITIEAPMVLQICNLEGSKDYFLDVMNTIFGKEKPVLVDSEAINKIFRFQENPGGKKLAMFSSEKGGGGAKKGKNGKSGNGNGNVKDSEQESEKSAEAVVLAEALAEAEKDEEKFAEEEERKKEGGNGKKDANKNKPNIKLLPKESDNSDNSDNLDNSNNNITPTSPSATAPSSRAESHTHSSDCESHTLYELRRLALATIIEGFRWDIESVHYVTAPGDDEESTAIVQFNDGRSYWLNIMPFGHDDGCPEGHGHEEGEQKHEESDGSDGHKDDSDGSEA